MFKTILDAFRTLFASVIILLLFYIVAVVWMGLNLKLLFTVISFFAACGFIMWCFEGLSKKGSKPFLKLYKDIAEWIGKMNTKSNKN